MKTTPIILVPGFWLGAWAWDEVAAALRAHGHDVRALTLPGLESTGADRSRVTLADHVDAISDAVRAAGRPVVLAVDSGPATGALDPEFSAVEKPLPTRKELAENESLEGLSEEQLETFRRRAVPEPGGALREAPKLTNDARLDVPTTVVCTSMTSEQIKDAVKKGYAWIGGLAELREVTYVDLPTSHWPMWSRPQELAAVIGDVAKVASAA